MKPYKITNPCIPLVALLLTAFAGLCSAEPQEKIARVELMPNIPQPFEIRDWRQVTRDYLNLILDFERRGDFLPAVRWQDASHKMVSLPTYIGSNNGPEAINFLGAIVSGALIGLDMTSFRGENWALMSTNYLGDDGVCTNNPHGRTGNSFWYDTLPNILFFQVADLCPTAIDPGQLRGIAERWREACISLGAKEETSALPNFDHQAFNFGTMTPVDGTRIEPEAGAGIAWVELMAWQKFKDPKFLTAADWALRALEQKPAEANPLYESILPYGALAAARMNAELGRNYDLAKWLDWCFEPRDRPQARIWWGVLAERFGTYDCHGLVGSMRDTMGYGFTMNGFVWAGALAPVARYDTRYARAIGKWLLNLTNASRLFYANALPPEHQDARDWADRNDPSYCIAYEGLRKQALRCAAATDFKTVAGKIKSGSSEDTFGVNQRCEVLEAENGRLEHIWEFALIPGEHALWLSGWAEGTSAGADAAGPGKGITFSFSNSPEGPWTELFTVDPQKPERAYGRVLKEAGPRVYIKASATRPGTLHVDRLRIHCLNRNLSPYATGDPANHGWGPSNYGLYGSSYVGILGALVNRTEVAEILRLDLLKTDYFHAPAWPTFLYFNPHPVAKKVSLDVGEQPCHLYDAATHRFVARNARAATDIDLPPDSAAVIVVIPASAKLQTRNGRLLADERVVDFRICPALNQAMKP